jgi:inositol-hexakisphosphate 5-kinase
MSSWLSNVFASVSGQEESDWRLELTSKGLMAREELEGEELAFNSRYPGGRMTLSEFCEWNEQRVGATQSYWQCVFQVLDADLDGRLDVREYMNALAIARHGSLVERLTFAFHIYADKTGLLQRQLLRQRFGELFCAKSTAPAQHPMLGASLSSDSAFDCRPSASRRRSRSLEKKAQDDDDDEVEVDDGDDDIDDTDDSGAGAKRERSHTSNAASASSASSSRGRRGAIGALVNARRKPTWRVRKLLIARFEVDSVPPVRVNEVLADKVFEAFDTTSTGDVSLREFLQVCVADRLLAKLVVLGLKGLRCWRRKHKRTKWARGAASDGASAASFNDGSNAAAASSSSLAAAAAAQQQKRQEQEQKQKEEEEEEEEEEDTQLQRRREYVHANDDGDEVQAHSLAALGLRTFGNQVAGHKGKGLSMLRTRDSRRIWKPYSETEFEFYEQLRDIDSSDFIFSVTPRYYGRSFVVHEGERVPYIVMENLTHGMAEPSICDLKIGTQGHDQNAPLSKLIQQKTLCAATTSRKIGFRICGMRVWRDRATELVAKGKPWGALIRGKAGMQDALRFFLNDGDRVRIELIPAFLQRLVPLLRWFKSQHLFCFYSSSIILVYESAPVIAPSASEPGLALGAAAASSHRATAVVPHVVVRMVDFAHTHPIEDNQTLDTSYITGLSELVVILQAIYNERLTIGAAGALGSASMPNMHASMSYNIDDDDDGDKDNSKNGHDDYDDSDNDGDDDDDDAGRRIRSGSASLDSASLPPARSEPLTLNSSLPLSSSSNDHVSPPLSPSSSTSASAPSSPAASHHVPPPAFALDALQISSSPDRWHRFERTTGHFQQCQWCKKSIFGLTHGYLCSVCGYVAHSACRKQLDGTMSMICEINQ